MKKPTKQIEIIFEYDSSIKYIRFRSPKKNKVFRVQFDKNSHNLYFNLRTEDRGEDLDVEFDVLDQDKHLFFQASFGVDQDVNSHSETFFKAVYQHLIVHRDTKKQRKRDFLPTKRQRIILTGETRNYMMVLDMIKDFIERSPNQDRVAVELKRVLEQTPNANERFNQGIQEINRYIRRSVDPRLEFVPHGSCISGILTKSSDIDGSILIHTEGTTAGLLDSPNWYTNPRKLLYRLGNVFENNHDFEIMEMINHKRIRVPLLKVVHNTDLDMDITAFNPNGFINSHCMWLYLRSSPLLSAILLKLKLFTKEKGICDGSKGLPSSYGWQLIMLCWFASHPEVKKCGGLQCRTLEADHLFKPLKMQLVPESHRKLLKETVESCDYVNYRFDTREAKLDLPSSLTVDSMWNDFVKFMCFADFGTIVFDSHSLTIRKINTTREKFNVIDLFEPRMITHVHGANLGMLFKTFRDEKQLISELGRVEADDIYVPASLRKVFKDHNSERVRVVGCEEEWSD
ncbi:hypothetical protein PCE1_004524 [Barthelona sp. PCE]